jgi:polyferredoxin
MNAIHYQRIKRAVATTVLLISTLVFSDIGNWISAPLARAALWFQFTPSLLALLQGAGWIAGGCLAVILLTLLFGRVYCSMLCPLGIFMDLAARLAKRTGRKRKLPYQNGHTRIRISVIVICVAGLLLGSAQPLGFLDPYSVFGKMISATLRPLLGMLNHGISATHWIHPVDVSPVSWTMAGVAAGLMAIIAILSIRHGRLWCNSVCPVGALLGFFSKHALFRLEIAKSACVGCSMCERVCPAQCIDFRNHAIDHSRCVMCLDCVTSCRKNGISLRKSWGEKPPPVPTTPAPVQAVGTGIPSLKRRTFLASTLALPAIAWAEGGHGDHRGGGGHGKACRGGLNQFNKQAVLPPGAISLDHFQSHCTACQLCVTHCPDQVLRPSISQHGLRGFLQPFQDFETSFCSYNCSNCSQICPTGAIQPLTVAQRKTVRTGVAEFFRGRCVVKTEGTSCGACSEHCPTQAVHMVKWKNGLTIPEVDPDLCIGCGGCEFICPVRPHKAIIVNGLGIHEQAKVVTLGNQNTVRKMEEEFPF